MLIQILLIAAGTTCLFLLTVVLFAIIMGRKSSLSDDGAAVKNNTEDTESPQEQPPAAPPNMKRLLDMDAEERLDAQRSYIIDASADHRTPYVIEFIANVTPYGIGTYKDTDIMRKFSVDLKNVLTEYLPLGGKIFSLPYRRTGEVVPHSIVSIQTYSEIDAHELAEKVCSEVNGCRDVRGNPVYSRVTFLPVNYEARKRHYYDLFQAGANTGTWRIASTEDIPMTYTHVRHRTDQPSLTEHVEDTAKTVSWAAARANLTTITDEFAAFEFSPMDVAFNRRLLWDLTEPATARFYEAFDAANMLLTDTEPVDPTAFIDAVRTASAAWKAADRNARDKAEQGIAAGNSIMDADCIKHRDTAKAAMTLALDPATTDSEAGVAWSRAINALGKAGLTVPPSKIRKLEGNALVQRATRALTS